MLTKDRRHSPRLCARQCNFATCRVGHGGMGLSCLLYVITMSSSVSSASCRPGKNFVRYMISRLSCSHVQKSCDPCLLNCSIRCSPRSIARLCLDQHLPMKSTKSCDTNSTAHRSIDWQKSGLHEWSLNQREFVPTAWTGETGGQIFSGKAPQHDCTPTLNKDLENDI